MTEHLLSRIEVNMHTFSKGQKRIANFIEEHYDRADRYQSEAIEKQSPESGEIVYESSCKVSGHTAYGHCGGHIALALD